MYLRWCIWQSLFCIWHRCPDRLGLARQGGLAQLPVWPCCVSTVACGFSHPDLSSCLFLPLSPACLFVTFPVVSILLVTCQPVPVRNTPPRQLDKSAGQASAHQAWDLDCGLASQGQIAALAGLDNRFVSAGALTGSSCTHCPQRSDHVLPTPREPTCGETLCPDYASLHPQ